MRCNITSMLAMLAAGISPLFFMHFVHVREQSCQRRPTQTNLRRRRSSSRQGLLRLMMTESCSSALVRLALGFFMQIPLLFLPSTFFQGRYILRIRSGIV
jgi:hypothetical protein